MNQEEHWILQEKYAGKETADFKKDIERLKAGEPLDFIIGFREFLDCKIDLSKKPLIPRDETEFWVEQAIEDMKGKKNLHVLDIFSGSGCMGVAVLKHIPSATVVFAEKDKEALGQIKINAKLNKLPKTKYIIVESDVFRGLKSFLYSQEYENDFKFDYILANPPYIPRKRKDKIQKSVIEHEPEISLFGGEDGLLYIEEFLSKAQQFLNPGGKIYMEFDSIQKKGIEALLKKFNYKKWEFNKDQFGKIRYLVVSFENSY